MRVAFLWHFHQPPYVDPATGRLALPWVRLHAVRGYRDMAEALRRIPDMQATFNFSGSLLEQLDRYQKDQDGDLDLQLTLTPADSLTPDEKRQIVDRFFSVRHETMLTPYRRYVELFERRDAWPQWTTQDWLDLQVWFNLTWFGWSAIEIHPEIKWMRGKGREFSEFEKKVIMKYQAEMVREVPGLFRALVEEGRAEISVSPMYHPILPLLINTDFARRPRPDATLPKSFAYPQDAEAQIREAMALAEKMFGRPPEGMWPSEGSVCAELVPIWARAGISWAATDEEILLRALPGKSRVDLLSRPYAVRVGESEVKMAFRDREISDLISFVYSRIPPEEGRRDFVRRLKERAAQVPDGGIVVALDGENPWESYGDSGRGFILGVYDEITRSAELEPATMGSYTQGATAVLPELPTGSWIGGNFDVWIGDKEDRVAWELLREAREAYEKSEKSQAPALDLRERARKALFRAEASDWFWWFGPEYPTLEKKTYDRLFRSNLEEVYRVLGLAVPTDLNQPLYKTTP